MSTVCVPLGLRKVRERVLKPIIENLTTTLSADCSCMLNSPFIEAIVSLPCAGQATVTISMGLPSSSTTLPFSVKLSANAFMLSVMTTMSSSSRQSRFLCDIFIITQPSLFYYNVALFSSPMRLLT